MLEKGYKWGGRQILTSAVALVMILLPLWSCTAKEGPKTMVKTERQLFLTSPAFPHEGMIPAKYTCDGDDINPPLDLNEIPPETQSMALIVDDPDAPMGTWVHWLVWNIDPTIHDIKENSVPPSGMLGKNSFKKLAYGGPCPPFGTHRYYFKLFALDTRLSLPEGSDFKALEEAMQGHILAKGVTMGRYKRK